MIYDENDQQQLVKSVMRRLGIDDKQTTPRSVLAHISWAKNHMLDPQEVYLQSADPKTERVAQIYAEYKKELAKANALDFDDLLLETVRLLKAAAPVREYYNRRFQYILVDEYQDTNRPQYELMRLLAGTRHNVCAVGDEDQSIYSWRGADIRNILEFEKDFPEAKIIRLEQNYRSTQNILQAASAVVANNLKRKGKNLWTSRQGGTKLGYYEAPDGENEALFAADYIAKYLREAVDQGENARAAVLYRTNSQSRLFEEAMRRYQLKYHVVGGFSFYERAEIKDMISYLKVIHNVDDSISLLRVINTPVRGIGKTTIEVLERVALETGVSLWGAIGEAIRRQLLPQRALGALKSFRRLIEDGRAMLAGTYVERLEETAREADVPLDEPAAEADVSFDPGEDENISFDFGAVDFDIPVENVVPAEAGEGARSTPARSEGLAPQANKVQLRLAPRNAQVIARHVERLIVRRQPPLAIGKLEASGQALGKAHRPGQHVAHPHGSDPNERGLTRFHIGPHTDHAVVKRSHRLANTSKVIERHALAEGKLTINHSEITFHSTTSSGGNGGPSVSATFGQEAGGSASVFESTGLARSGTSFNRSNKSE